MMPRSIGLCSDPDHTSEFYMPDAKAGDKCPQCPNELTIYLPYYRPKLAEEPASVPVAAASTLYLGGLR